MTRLFGTDGIRGVANVDLARRSRSRSGGRPPTGGRRGRLAGRGPGHPAFGRHVRGGDHRRRDEHGRRRALGRASCPTPALAFLAADGEFAAGIMVSASHNPAEDNGLKVLDPRGLKLDDDVEDELEAAGAARGRAAGRRRPGRSGGRVERVGCSARTSPIASRSRRPSTRRGLHVVLDAANGAAYRVAARDPRARPGRGSTVIHDAPDGDNINRGSGATAPASLAAAVAGRGADIGFALDGDADRLRRGRLARASSSTATRSSASSRSSACARGALDHGEPRRVGALERRPAGGGRGGRRADRPDAGRRQAHPRRDAGVGRRPRRREERPRDRPRAHHVGRRDRHRARAAAGDDAPRARRSPSSPTAIPLLPSSSGRSGSATGPVGGRRRPRARDRRRGARGSRRTAASSSGPRARSPSCGSWSRARTPRSSPSWPTPSRRSQASDYTSQPRRGRELEPKEIPQAHVRHRRLYRSP